MIRLSFSGVRALDITDCEWKDLQVAIATALAGNNPIQARAMMGYGCFEGAQVTFGIDNPIPHEYQVENSDLPLAAASPRVVCRNPNHALTDGSAFPHEIGPSCMAASPQVTPSGRDWRKIADDINGEYAEVTSGQAEAPTPAEILPETVPSNEPLVTCKGQPEPHIRIHACREPIVEVGHSSVATQKCSMAHSCPECGQTRARIRN